MVRASLPRLSACMRAVLESGDDTVILSRILRSVWFRSHNNKRFCLVGFTTKLSIRYGTIKWLAVVSLNAYE